MSISTPGAVPSRQRPATFADDMDAFLAWLEGAVGEFNAATNAMQQSAAMGASTTTHTIGTGSKTFAASADKVWSPGGFVYIANAAAVANVMVGQIQSYDVGTGALLVNVTTALGSGTTNNWIIGLATPDLAGRFITNIIDQWGVDSSGAARAYFQAIGGTNGSTYLRGYGDWPLRVQRADGGNVFAVSATGRVVLHAPAEQPEDAVRKSQMDAAIAAATQQATEAARGTVELATPSEALAGVDADRALTPATLRAAMNASGAAPIFGVRAWAQINASTGTLISGGNIASITKNGTGDITLTFATALPTADYAVSGTASGAPSGAPAAPSNNLLLSVHCTNGVATLKSTAAVRVMASDNNSDNAWDATYVSVVIVC